MFFDIYYKLCKANGTSPNAVAKLLGIASSTVTQWKQGSVPKADALSRISTHFGVSIDYLLGNTDIKNKPTTQEDDELILREPSQFEFAKKFSKLTKEQQDMIIAQMEVLIKRHPSDK